VAYRRLSRRHQTCTEDRRDTSRREPPRGDRVYRRERRREGRRHLCTFDGYAARRAAGRSPPQRPGSPAWLAQGYLLEYGPDALTLHRAGGSFVAAFPVRGYTREAIRYTVEKDRRGWPAYCEPDEYAYSVRRMVETRAGQPWERFVRAERRVLEARRRGQMARALTWRLPGEAREVLDRIASEDRRRAEEGLVELRSEEGARKASSTSSLWKSSPPGPHGPPQGRAGAHRVAPGAAREIRRHLALRFLRGASVPQVVRLTPQHAQADAFAFRFSDFCRSVVALARLARGRSGGSSR
jgi:hypothetical protein